GASRRGSQPMADVTKAEWQALNDRVRALETDMVLVRLAKWAFGLSVVALVGAIAAFIYSAGSINNEVANHIKRLDKLETALADEQKQRTESHERLFEMIAHINVPRTSMLVSKGKVVRADDESLVVHMAVTETDIVFTKIPQTATIE